MRARLHRAPGTEEDASEPILLDPQSLVNTDCPGPPEPDDVADALRSDPGETYSIDAHRERYQETLQHWRATVLDLVRETTVLADAETEITIHIMGTVDEP